MGGKILGFEKSRVVDSYLRGCSRDETARKTGKSGGTVSGIVNEFKEEAESTSLDEAADKYDVLETVESLRGLAVQIRENDSSVEELIFLSKMLQRIKKLTSLDNLEEFIEAGEDLHDSTHVQAAIKLHTLENRLGKTHDAILKEVETAETTKNQLNQEAQRLQTQITSLQDEKTKVETELQNELTQRKLTLERMEQISQLNKALTDNCIELSNVELLQNMLNFVREAGGDPKKLVELAETIDSLNLQIETETKKLYETQNAHTNLDSKNKRTRRRLEKAKNPLKKYHALISMGWTDENLEKVLKLAKAVGKPVEVLCRFELLKSSKDAQLELDRIKAESETLKQENMKAVKRITRRLRRLENESSELVEEKIPSILNQIDKHSQLQTSIDKLIADCARYQKCLDEAICWTTLLQAPEKLPGTTVYRILFEILFPRLQAWSKNKSNNERQELARELFKRALEICIEDSTTLMNMTAKASPINALKTVLSFAKVTSPLYVGILTWYNLHRGEKDVEGFFDVQYYLTKLFEEGISKIGESPRRTQ
jgi:myosin heavy subunit